MDNSNQIVADVRVSTDLIQKDLLIKYNNSLPRGGLLCEYDDRDTVFLQSHINEGYDFLINVEDIPNLIKALQLAHDYQTKRQIVL